MIPGFATMMISGGGVVPDPANWGDIADSNSPIVITGLGETIIMRAELDNFSKSPAHRVVSTAFYAVVNGSIAGSADPAESGAFCDFSVSPGSSLFFSGAADAADNVTVSFDVTVKFKSPGSPTFDQTLDTFSAELTVEGSE